MNLESSTVNVAQSAEYLFTQLSDVANFEKLMPESTAKFEVLSPTSFVFGLQGMPEIKLVLKTSTPNTQLVLGAASDKLPFTLTANLVELSSENTAIQLLFEGEFNAMMAMMIKGPISKFIETLAQNMNRL
ncbi:MAG: hypothetical protein RIT03_824 [Bacteroidota bacterium]|jgi:hypothetical protein